MSSISMAVTISKTTSFSFSNQSHLHHRHSVSPLSLSLSTKCCGSIADVTRIRLPASASRTVSFVPGVLSGAGGGTVLHSLKCCGSIADVMRLGVQASASRTFGAGTVFLSLGRCGSIADVTRFGLLASASRTFSFVPSGGDAGVVFLYSKRCGSIAGLPRFGVLASASRTFSLVPGAGDGTVLQDAGATVLIMAGAYGLVGLFDSLTRRDVIQQSLSRKLVHVLSGLLFMASWPLFSASGEARLFASVVPLTNCLRLLIYGLSLAKDDGLIKSVTREGNPKELLRGPLYYVLILILCAVVFWRESPVGVISLAMMCGGDGVADIMGRRFGSVKIPYNQKKSWAGSLSMFVFGFCISLGMLYFFSNLGYFNLNWDSTVQRVTLVAFVATLVESLPISELIDDNISVPLSSMIVAYLTFSL